MEIERKFLLKRYPHNLESYDSSIIEQGYISFAPEVRIRNKSGKYTLTTKSDGDLIREEHEVLISKEIYEELKKIVKGYIIIKIRYEIPVGNYIAELDIYRGLDVCPYDCNGFVIEGIESTVEVEFESEEEAGDFAPPNWFGLEVTDDKTYKNKNIAKKYYKDYSKTI